MANLSKNLMHEENILLKKIIRQAIKYIDIENNIKGQREACTF